MTSERRIAISVNDIKLIACECRQCKARVSFTPDKGFEVPFQCLQCRAKWLPDVPRDEPIRNNFQYAALTAVQKFIGGVQLMRNADIANTYGSV